MIIKTEYTEGYKMVRFGDILEELANINPLKPPKSEVQSPAERLRCFYNSNERHKYHEIAEYIYSCPEDIEYIVYALNEIRKINDYSDLEPMIFKILDHIQLEQIRLEYSETELLKQAMMSVAKMEISLGERTGSIQMEVKKIMNMSKQLSRESTASQERLANFEEDLGSFDGQVQSIEEQFKDVKEKLNNFNMESITVLGIFSGIVMAFFGGMSFFNGVLNNIHQVSKYRITLITLIIGFTIFNIMFLLIYSISKIVNKPIRSKCSTPNCSCDKKCNPINTLRKIYPVLFYIDLIFILMIIGVLALWFSNNSKEIIQFFNVLSKLKYLLAGLLFVVVIYKRKFLRANNKQKNIVEHNLSN